MNELPLILDDISLATRNNLILQENRIAAHTAIVVRIHLNENFGIIE
jgi:hypothetical protein